MLSWFRLTLRWVVRSPGIEARVERVVVVADHVIDAVMIRIVLILSFSRSISHRILTIQLHRSSRTKQRLMFIVPVWNNSTHHDLASIVEDCGGTVWYGVSSGMLLSSRILLSTCKQVLSLQCIVDLIEHLRCFPGPIKLISVILLSRVLLAVHPTFEYVVHVSNSDLTGPVGWHGPLLVFL